MEGLGAGGSEVYRRPLKDSRITDIERRLKELEDTERDSARAD